MNATHLNNSLAVGEQPANVANNEAVHPVLDLAPTKLPKISGIYSLRELLARPITEVPKLVAPLLPRQGVAVLAGSSDTGKSSILRQLALAVVMGEKEFLSFPVNPLHYRAICVSTEDGDEAIGPLLKMQLYDRIVPEGALDNMQFVFDTENLPEKLDRMLTEAPADLVVVDALGDLFDGNLNQSNEVRRFITKYSNLAVKHGCLFFFMHHTGKRSEEREPSKHNLLGSQGLEAKMRVVFELRIDPYIPQHRHLCVIKGNYLPQAVKDKSYVLHFDEHLTFHNTGKRMVFGDIVKGPEESAKERELWGEAKELLIAGNSFEKVQALLIPIARELGVAPPSKSVIARRFPKSALTSHHSSVPNTSMRDAGMLEQPAGC